MTCRRACRPALTTALAVVLVPLLALTVLSASLAAAATGRLSDPVESRLPAESDLVGVRVVNGPRVLRITVRLRELDPARTSAYALLHRPRADVGYAVGSQSRRQGHRTVFARFGEDADPEFLRCRGLRVRLDVVADAIRIRLPQRCLGDDAGTQVVTGLTEGARGDVGDVDDTRSVRVRRG